MRLFPHPLLTVRRAGTLLAALLLAAGSASAQTIMDASMAKLRSSQGALSDFFDRLPDLLDFGLPSFAPRGSFSLYARPRFGDLIHEDYFRLPVGARFKFSQEFEFNTELGTYVTHGFGDDVGNGLYQFGAGLKREHVLSPDSGWSSGIGWVTPLSRPPHGITDGLRHTLPYVTFTRTIYPDWGAVGFATLGADLLDHTSLTPDFRTNQLRANSLILTLGVARQWRRMHVILRVSNGTTWPLSDLHQNAFGLRPSIGIPLWRRADGSPRATATFEARGVWGPDGFETGVTTRIRVDFHHRQRRPSN